MRRLRLLTTSLVVIMMLIFTTTSNVFTSSAPNYQSLKIIFGVDIDTPYTTIYDEIQNVAATTGEPTTNTNGKWLDPYVYEHYKIVAYGLPTEKSSDFYVRDDGYMVNGSGKKGEYKYLGENKAGVVITNDRYFASGTSKSTFDSEDDYINTAWKPVAGASDSWAKLTDSQKTALKTNPFRDDDYSGNGYVPTTLTKVVKGDFSKALVQVAPTMWTVQGSVRLEYGNSNWNTIIFDSLAHDTDITARVEPDNPTYTITKDMTSIKVKYKVYGTVSGDIVKNTMLGQLKDMSFTSIGADNSTGGKHEYTLNSDSAEHYYEFTRTFKRGSGLKEGSNTKELQGHASITTDYASDTIKSDDATGYVDIYVEPRVVEGTGKIQTRCYDADTNKEIDGTGNTLPEIQYNTTTTVSVPSAPNGYKPAIGGYKSINSTSNKSLMDKPATPQTVTITKQYDTIYVFFYYEKLPPDTTNPTDPVIPPPPVIVNYNPIAVINNPDIVYAGDDVKIDGSNSYDLDGTVEHYEWELDGTYGYVEEEGINSIGDKPTGYAWYPDAGDYQLYLKVTDDDNETGDASSSITVLPPIPHVVFNISADKLKENRKIILDASESTSAQKFPIDWSITTWIIEPNVGTGATKDYGVRFEDGRVYKNVGSIAWQYNNGVWTSTGQIFSDILKGQKKLQFQARDSGTYTITVNVTNTGTFDNTKHYSNFSQKEIVVVEDLAPIASFSGAVSNIREIESPNGTATQKFGKINVKCTTESPDKDPIGTRDWGYIYDSDNDGSFSDEVIKYPVSDSTQTLTNGQRLVDVDPKDIDVEIQTYDVGKYTESLTVCEDILDTETVNELLLSTDIRKAYIQACNIQEMKNTPPVANFTVEKNRNVKIMVLSDYTGSDIANLKNSITSMKSELANDAKIDVQYITPTDITIGTQNGMKIMNTWGMKVYGKYSWSGYIEGTTSEGFPIYNDRPLVNETMEVFSHSPTRYLLEGEKPTDVYKVPTSFKASEPKYHSTDHTSTTYIVYNFFNSDGLCDGSTAINTDIVNSYDSTSHTSKTIISGPTFTYDNFWSIMRSDEIPVTNTVMGWDLSKINYNTTDNADYTDTYIVFAMNNEDTNYFSQTHPNTYKLGQLRNDTNFGKYIKDTNARVYSICSNTLENINLSTNAKYPITFNSTQQNTSIKDLINNSIDGRSFGTKNITSLVNKIKENIKKPSNGNIDMIVATDKDVESTNNFIESVKNNVSADVDVQTNIVDKSSLEDTPAWTKYVVNGKYRNIFTIRKDVTLVLMDNGELWAMGSNFAGGSDSIDSYGNVLDPPKYGLLGVGSNAESVIHLVKIATGVKDATIVDATNYDSLIVLKNDGTVWISGYVDEYYRNDKKYNIIYNTLTQTGAFGYVYRILSGYSNTFNYETYDGKIHNKYIGSNYGDYQEEDMNAPCYAPYEPSSSMVKYISGEYYILEDGTIYKKSRYRNDAYYPYVTSKIGKTPSPIREIGGGLMYCEDNNIYKLSDLTKKLNTNPVKQVFLDSGYFVESDSNVYRYYIRYDYNNQEVITKITSNVDKILFVEKYIDCYGRVCPEGTIVKNLNGEIKIVGQVSDINKLPQTDTFYYDKNNDTVDFSCNNTAADYLQIGNYFAYITKSGELYAPIVQNNIGKLESQGKFNQILSSSISPVKAFSKSRILNTTLREGSERYFIYISDTIKQDTYFSTTPDYFLFGNLDSTILNYLKANNFNIYVVTPQQALDLKLQYPYVPTNIQQYTLRDLVNNTTKDSSICKNTNEIVSLISRKYSMYAKQGSTTLTLLVDEEGMNYSLVYRDFENDPKYADRWKYTHDDTYFDNPNGLANYSGQWLTTPAYSFSKVGKYSVVSQFRDNPKDVSSFDNYRLWSNVSAPATIIVHRRPIANFNTQIVSKAGTDVTLSYIDYSYDIDHNISRTDKGIVARSWQYRKQGEDTWIEGKPINLEYNSGVYQIRLKVRDIEGAWSKPYIDTIDTANLIPTIDASPTEYNGAGPINIIITASDHGEGDLVLASSTYSPKTRYALTNSSAKPSSGWNDLPSKTYTLPTITTAGTYYLHMEAYDASGQRFYRVRGPYIISLPPTIDASPTTFNGFGPLNIIITANDNGENDLVLAGSSYSPSTRYALTYSAIKPLSGWKDLSAKVYNLPSITAAGTYYLHMEAYDTSGQSFYRVRGPYTVETLKASHFYITMMLDIGWRSYYFDVDNGIDDNHDGKIDKYPKRINTDIGTMKMPINYFNMVGYTKTYLKAGYKVKGKIDIIGNPDWAKFDINYIKEGKTYTDTVSLTKSTGDTFTFEWIVPLETDTKTFVSFDLITKKGDKTYGNEKWLDTWDARNTSRLVFYVKGKATDDIIYVQSQ